MKHTHAHAIVEIAHAAEKTADALEKTHSAVSKGSRVMQAISVTQAFRKYKWLSATPELNNAGNFRGMVVSARWRSVYQISTNVHHAAERTEKAAKNLGAFATFAGALISVSGELEDISNSADEPLTKAAKYSTQVTSIALRFITGTLVVPETKFILSALAVSCSAVNGVTGGKSEGAQNLRQFAQDYKNSIDVKFQQFTDGKELFHLIDTRVNPYIWDHVVSKF